MKIGTEVLSIRPSETNYKLHSTNNKDVYLFYNTKLQVENEKKIKETIELQIALTTDDLFYKQ